MINGLSASLSLALRTASNAQKRVDIATQQIATGKKVNSVKDDGAAYIRAADLKSQQAQNNARLQLTALYRQETNLSGVDFQDRLDTLNNMSNILLRAKSYPIGHEARKALAAEFEQAKAELIGHSYEPATIVSGFGDWSGKWGVQTTASDALLNGRVVTTTLSESRQWMLDTNDAGSVTLGAVNIETASAAQLHWAKNNAKYLIEAWGPYLTQQTSDTQNWLDSVENITNNDTDRLENAISSLTDADMGIVSRERELAQTRQELAYSSVRNALTQYSNYANGLLSNVLSSKRGLLA